MQYRVSYSLHQNKQSILMKMTNHFLVSVLILLALVPASHLTADAVAAPAAVLDMSGRDLRSGIKYYVLPFLHGRGGGLTLAGRNKSTCPFNVAQDVHEVSPGLPLTFHPVNPKKGVVRLTTDLNIAFSAATHCAKLTVWRLGGFDVATGQRYVSIGGVAGNPGGSTLSNWFKIERFGHSKNYYKLVFCPSVCRFCKVVCGDVGIVNEGGRRWLGLSDKPFPIMFKKVQ